MLNADENCYEVVFFKALVLLHSWIINIKFVCFKSQDVFLLKSSFLTVTAMQIIRLSYFGNILVEASHFFDIERFGVFIFCSVIFHNICTFVYEYCPDSFR